MIDNDHGFGLAIYLIICIIIFGCILYATSTLGSISKSLENISVELKVINSNLDIQNNLKEDEK